MRCLSSSRLAGLVLLAEITACLGRSGVFRQKQCVVNAVIRVNEASAANGVNLLDNVDNRTIL
jgi:hypothetical protein